MQRDKQLTEATDDNLREFGLQEPALVLRFKIGDTWRELIVGDLNPVGDAHYAKTGDSNAVFLMARGNWSIFDKQANELRRRQLFSFDPRSVTALDINWQGGEHILVTKDAAGTWKSPDHADKVIKKSKVDRVLDQVHWLRAVDFLAENSQDMKILWFGSTPGHRKTPPEGRSRGHPPTLARRRQYQESGGRSITNGRPGSSGG